MGRIKNTEGMDSRAEERRIEIIMRNGNDGLHYDKGDEDDESWGDYLKDLSDREQPDVCNLDDPDCENCGS